MSSFAKALGLITLLTPLIQAQDSLGDETHLMQVNSVVQPHHTKKVQPHHTKKDAKVLEEPFGPVPHTYEEETQFLENILRSFGKNKPGYAGKQRLLGFQKDERGAVKLFDEKGMFAFDDSIHSVAFDVGAANNPLSFDIPEDGSQVVFMFEPGWKDAIGEAFEWDANGMWSKERGGCDTKWDPFCAQDRFLWFSTAVSPKVGYTSFMESASPYCGSLGGFTPKDDGSIDPEFAADKEMAGSMDGCWNDKASSMQVATVSLESILKRIPKRIAVKYVKIDAQGHDYQVLLSAGPELPRLDYVRFEMQVDPPANRKMVKEIPSYTDVVKFLATKGFTHDGDHACDDSTMSEFSKAIKEMECKFCREPPCIESRKSPMGMHPWEVVKRQGNWAQLLKNSSNPEWEWDKIGRLTQW